MYLPIVLISTLIQIYSIEYMGSDPHRNRFFSFLSKFCLAMLILVSGENFFIIILGWELVGLASYLLIGFWNTRISANMGAKSALFQNKIGDWTFIIALTLFLSMFGDLSLATIFSLASHLNQDLVMILTFLVLITAASKSALFPLNTWLLRAMEGPTSVSALLHSSTMVMVAIVKIYYMQKKLKIPLGIFLRCKFIEAFIYYCEFYKKILFLIVNNLLINPQVFSPSLDGYFNENSKDSQISLIMNFSNNEKTPEIISKFNFSNYMDHIPLHKKKDNLDYKFLEWFIGFTEGDGSFVIYNNKVYFDLTQDLRDIKLLNKIRTELGFGTILTRIDKHRNVGVFYLTGKENFLRFIHLFNGNLLSTYKKEQFKIWLNTFNKQYGYNISYIDSYIPVSFNSAWLSGFIDAEGSFKARIKNCNTSKLGEN
jgi:hypothetical protein